MIFGAKGRGDFNTLRRAPTMTTSRSSVPVQRSVSNCGKYCSRDDCSKRSARLPFSCAQVGKARNDGQTTVVAFRRIDNHRHHIGTRHRDAGPQPIGHLDFEQVPGRFLDRVEIGGRCGRRSDSGMRAAGSAGHDQDEMTTNWIAFFRPRRSIRAVPSVHRALTWPISSRPVLQKTTPCESNAGRQRGQTACRVSFSIEILLTGN